MTTEELRDLFEKHDDEFLKFDRIESPRHRRPDVCAFIMLDEVSGPSSHDMVSAAEHDEIWLDVNVEDFAERASEDVVRDLIRCGVRYDRSTDSFAMFV